MFLSNNIFKLQTKLVVPISNRFKMITHLPLVAWATGQMANPY